MRSTDTFTLLFPDGTKIAGWRWSIMGFYYRDFPDSGIHSGQLNQLRFTSRALDNEGIRFEAIDEHD
jgi:hypothetical protein